MIMKSKDKTETINWIISDIDKILRLELYWEFDNWPLVERYLNNLGFHYLPALMSYDVVEDFEPYQMPNGLDELQDIPFCISANNDLNILPLYLQHITRFSQNKNSILL